MWATLFFVALVALGVLYCTWRMRCRRLQARADSLQRELTALRRESDQQLAETSARQIAMFNSMSEGILVLTPDRRVQSANNAAIRLLQLGPDVKGRPLVEVLRRHELHELIGSLAAGDAPREIHLEIPGPPSKLLQVTASLLQDANHQVQGILLGFHDLTRLKQLESIRTDFVANVSHELRTPLSIIKGYVETLLTHPNSSPEISARFLKTIEKHADHLTFLIEDLLTLSQLESRGVAMECRPTDLRKLADDVAQELKQAASEKQIELLNQIPAELTVHADARRIQQVFWNLIENAIKYGRSGGSVQIGARLDAASGIAECWVRDDGPGIPVEAQLRIFERFYRVDRARSRETGGTGLGLSIVKHIVQLHQGKVWVESQPPHGSTFRFTLPVRMRS